MDNLKNLSSNNANEIIYESWETIIRVCNEEDDELKTELRKGPWSSDEDSKLTSSVAIHGEGRWDCLASLAGKLLIIISSMLNFDNLFMMIRRDLVLLTWFSVFSQTYYSPLFLSRLGSNNKRQILTERIFSILKLRRLNSCTDFKPLSLIIFLDIKIIIKQIN